MRKRPHQLSQTLSGLFLVGALNRPRTRKGTNRENPRTIPEQIGKIPKKSGKSQKGPEKDKKGRTSPDQEAPRLNPPRLSFTYSLFRASFPLPLVFTLRLSTAQWVLPPSGRVSGWRMLSYICSYHTLPYFALETFSLRHRI